MVSLTDTCELIREDQLLKYFFLKIALVVYNK